VSVHATASDENRPASGVASGKLQQVEGKKAKEKQNLKKLRKCDMPPFTLKINKT
jgi:hypothetical protein